MKTTTIIAALAATASALPTWDVNSWWDVNSGCPANAVQPDGKLTTQTIKPSLLLEISAKQPDQKFAPSNCAEITPGDKCVITNLDLPYDQTQNKICNLVFDFPNYLQGPGEPYLFWGQGHFTFTGYALGAGAVPGVTTYNNQPSPGPSPPNPPPVMTPGHSYLINSGACPPLPGTTKVSGALCSPDTYFKYTQGEGRCPFGFYVVLTDQ